jgi:carboxymethylenebutenolidase
MGTWIELTASDGNTFAAYRADPEGEPRGGLVVVQEIFGVNDHIRGVADGYAADGYTVIAPAMFDRVDHDIQLGYDSDAVTRGRALKAQITVDVGMLDIQAAIVATGAAKVGIVGFCWGGFMTWMASAHATGLACAIPYYGGGMLENMDITPTVPVLAHFGAKDPILPIEQVQRLIALHPQHTFHIYDADHGFNCDARGSYDEAAAKLARDRTLAFLRTHVG